MIDFESELKKILNEDPLGILKNRTVQPITTDQRLKDSFEEINKFIDENGGEPTESTDITERKLFSRLKQLRKDFDKASALKDLDRHNLLANVREIKSVDDILENDVLGLLDDGPDNIFDLKNIPKDKNKTDFVARRKPCKNFHEYEHKFKEIQKDLKNKKRKLIIYREAHLKEDRYFVLDGLLVYLEKIEEGYLKLIKSELEYPVLSIDTKSLDFEKSENDFQDILRLIIRASL